MIDWEPVVYSAIPLGSTLLALWMILRYRLQKTAESSSPEVRQLGGVVEELRRELQSLHDDVHVSLGDLHERMDFAERLLTAQPHRFASEEESASQPSPPG